MRQKMFFAGRVLFGLLAGAEAPVLSDILARLPIFQPGPQRTAMDLRSPTFGICVAGGRYGLQVSSRSAKRAGVDLLGVA